MYRIIFNPSTAKWQIQLACCLGLFWRTVTRLIKGCDGNISMELEFADFDEAAQYVADIGLAKVYRNWHDRPSIGFAEQR